MKKLFSQAQQFNALRRLLGWQVLSEALSNRLKTEIFTSPPNGKVLVLSPHPGDDIMGCGGVLAKHQEQGDDIRIIYLCDGRSGTKRAVTEIVRDELKKTRRAEAVSATASLGIQPGQLTFWSYRDGELPANKTTTKALTQVMTEYLPEIIYVPHFTDGDVDHVDTATLLVKSLGALGGQLPAEIWSYEINQPIQANRIIDINSSYNQKMNALRHQVSQLKCRAYDEAAAGLNRYRGAMHNLPGAAEAYLVLAPRFYLKLWDMLKSTVE